MLHSKWEYIFSRKYWKEWSISLGIALVTFIICFNLISLSNRKIDKITQEIEYEQNRNALLGSIENAQNSFNSYQKALPPMSDNAWLMQELTKLAKQTEVKLVSIQPHKVETVSSLKQMAVSLELDTSYHQLGRFVESIENAPIFLWIDEMNIEKKSIERVHEASDEVIGKALVTMVVQSFLLKE